jgi:hypothetical protein
MTSQLWGAIVNLRTAHLGYVVDKVTVGQVFLETVRFYPIRYCFSNAPYSFVRHSCYKLYKLKRL